MKAAIVRDKQFVVDEIPTPVPGPGQVLAKVRICGICGSDLHLFKHAEELLSTAEAAGMVIDKNSELILGHEFVAEVVAFGPDTEQRFNVGDRVCSIPFRKQGDQLLNIGTPAAQGAYAEYLLLTEEFLVPVPDALSDEAAALVEPLAVGVHAVAKSAITDSGSALVIGCGPIGLATIAILKMRGIEQIVAADYSPRRRGLAQQMGATLVVDPAEESPYQSFSDEPNGEFVVYECVGLPGLLKQIVDQVPKQAKIVMIGLCAGDDSYTPLTAMMKEVQIQFVYYYTPEEFSQSLEALSEGRVNWEPWVSSKINLDGVANAFRALQDPEREVKVLIEPFSK